MGDDFSTFDAVLEQIHEDLSKYPFHYGNEHPIAPELYSRLRSELSPPTVELEYRQDHSNKSQWRNRDMFDRLSPDQAVPRVRPEVEFFHHGTRWKGKKRDYDLAVFNAEEPLIMQGKKQGVGNFIDTASSVSVLCEIKHSLNMSARFRDGAEKDIQALSEYPGEADTRYFVFVDWWPRDGYGDPTFQSDIRRLRDRLPDEAVSTRIAYLPREGEMQLVSSKHE
jgi:hypothetical protein